MIYNYLLRMLNIILCCFVEITFSVGGVGSAETPFVYFFPQVPTVFDTVGNFAYLSVVLMWGQHSATSKQEIHSVS
jgi:hypothetical protein